MIERLQENVFFWRRRAHYLSIVTTTVSGSVQTTAKEHLRVSDTLKVNGVVYFKLDPDWLGIGAASPLPKGWLRREAWDAVFAAGDYSSPQLFQQAVNDCEVDPLTGCVLDVILERREKRRKLILGAVAWVFRPIGGRVPIIKMLPPLSLFGGAVAYWATGGVHSSALLIGMVLALILK